MANPISVGEAVSFARLAWKVYQLGWSHDFKASKSYSQVLAHTAQNRGVPIAHPHPNQPT